MEHQHSRSQCDPARWWRWLWLPLGCLLLAALMACGTATTTGSGAAPTGATGTSAPVGGTVKALPVDGHALNGQDRVGVAGQGAFLFFDAEG